LLLYGARQVGKTYLIREFAAQHFADFVYVNFERSPAMQSLFDGDISPERIIHLLETHREHPISPKNTLVFFDEIQVCERALTSLKYFAESTFGYHIAAAGSLLGVVLHRESFSFPVGKVSMETLHPLDFEEFLWAADKRKLVEEIRHSFTHDIPLSQALHEQVLELLHTYLAVGGMPACVDAYLKTKSSENVAGIQISILNAYLADMAKYTSPAESVKIRTAFDSIPVQLAKENKKFQYKVVKKGASASHFGVAIDWLCASGIVHKCHRTDQGSAPLAAHADLSAFKLYMSDTGLLCGKSGVGLQDIIMGIAGNFKGAIAENYCAQAFATNGHDLYYWESFSIAEVDFVLQRNSAIVPVEIKAADNVRSKSLMSFVQKYKPKYSIRISTKNFGFINGIKSVPIYAAFLV
jgi:uncharacterized protein